MIRTKPLWMGITLFLLMGCNHPEVEPFGPSVKVAPPVPPSSLPVPPSGMVHIPEGAFLMGSTDLGIATLPVVVSSFYLDQTEVTAEAYEACVTAGKCLPPTTGTTRGPNANSLCNWDDTKTPSQAAAEKKQHPMNCVTFSEAQKYCIAQGKRLPTEMEWEYAARWSNESLYPWGKAVPSVTDQPQRACWNRSSGTCAVKGSPATLLGMEESQLEAQGLVGLYDMAGNVWEWIDTQYLPTLSAPNKPCTDFMPSCVIRGGSWRSDNPSHLRSSFRYGNHLSGANHDLGFRCARAE